MRRGELIRQTLVRRGYDYHEAKQLAIQIIMNLDNYANIMDLAMKKKPVLMPQAKPARRWMNPQPDHQ